jgi:hypothetical protein
MFLHERAEAPFYPNDLYICSHCRHVQYLVDVISAGQRREVTELTSKSTPMVEHFKSYAIDTVRDLDLHEGDLVLDIGSNDGALLQCYKDLGLQVEGVDASLHAVKAAVDGGIPTSYCEFGSRLSHMLSRTPKLITANRVIANVPDVNDFLGGVRNLMATDTVFIFETGYLPDILEKNLFDTIYHEHIAYDLVWSLQMLMIRNHMQIYKVAHLDIKGGSIRCFVQRFDGGREKDGSVESMIAKERWVERPAFATMETRIKAERYSILDQLKGVTGTIAGFGASIGTITQTYAFELQNKLAYLLDDDPRHQGMFMPGTNWEVKNSTILHGETPPEAVVVFAWRYAKQIMDKHKGYKGKWVVPFS